MNGHSEKSLDIAIIGGGVAGVTLAIGLLKYEHIKVTIYESTTHLDHIGWGFAFGPNAQRAMKLIDPAIHEGFIKIANENTWPSKKNTWFDVRFGEDVEERGQRSGDRVGEILCPNNNTISRADFLNAIVRLLPRGTTKWGKRLADLQDFGDDGVLVRFKDGSEAVHSAVIGCDGIKSATRKYILGPGDPSATPMFAGKTCHRAAVPMDQAVAALGEELAMNNNLYIGKHGHINCFPVKNGTLMNVGAFMARPSWESETWVVPSTKEALAAEFESWGTVPRKIVDMVQNTDIWALFDYADNPSSTYYKGRVCVSGDAAHASTPFQGAGAAMAIEDAYVLSNLLGAVRHPRDIEAAFNAYDGVRRERTQRLVETSRDAGHVWGLDRPDCGDDYEKIMENVTSRMDWIWNEDLESELQIGQQIMAAA